MTRRSPRRNIDAADVVALLDSRATIEVDIDGVTRSYINGVWVTPTWKRQIRRWRNGHVRSLRPETLAELLNYFNLEDHAQF